MRERFWKWLRNLANEKVKACYMEQFHHDRKCERCNTWTSEVGGCTAIVDDGDDQLMTCKKCHHVSRWNMMGMLPDLVPGYVAGDAAEEHF